MFDEISERLKQAGVSTVRTMTDRDNKSMLSFFRSMGLRSGKSIELEMPLEYLGIQPREIKEAYLRGICSIQEV